MAQNIGGSLFYSPTISIYKFFKLFFAAIKQSDRTVHVIKGDIVEQLYRAKKSGNYDELLEEFSFFDNGIFVYSKQVEDGISQMQMSGLISKKNPRFVEIIINDELSVEKEKQNNEQLFSQVSQLVTQHVSPL